MPPARLLYLVTEDWYFMLHRLALARAAPMANDGSILGNAPLTVWGKSVKCMRLPDACK